MSEAEIQGRLRLVRYGGIVITITVLVILLAFAVVTGNAIPGASGATLNSLMPYIIGFTVLSAILSVVLFFGYRMYLTGKAQS